MREDSSMPEWLHTSLANGSDPAPAILVWRIGMAMVLGAAVAGIYRWARRGEVGAADVPDHAGACWPR